MVRSIIESLECIDKHAPLNVQLMSDEDIIGLWKSDVWQTEDFVDNLFVEKEFCFDGGSFNFESGCPMIGGEDMGLQRLQD